MAKGRQGQRTDIDVRDAIEDLIAKAPDTTASAIERKLRPDFGNRLPGLRAIQAIVRRARSTPRPDDSGQWTVAAADLDGLPQILETLAVVIVETEGRKANFTREEARWVVKLAEAAPDLGCWNRWRLARLYVVRALRDLPNRDLDAYLSFAPWRDAGAARNWMTAVAKGWVPEPPYFLLPRLLDERQSMWGHRGMETPEWDDRRRRGVVRQIAQDWLRDNPELETAIPPVNDEGERSSAR